MSVLSNLDIEDIMNGLRIPLIGVFPKDALPAKPADDGFIVMNMSDKGEVGTHWVGLALIGTTPIYYDPFGIAPPTEVVHLFEKYKPILYNTKQIQDINDTYCGWSVIAWAFHMFHGRGNQHRTISRREVEADFSKYLNLYDDTDRKLNRHILMELMKRIAKRKPLLFEFFG